MGGVYKVHVQVIHDDWVLVNADTADLAVKQALNGADWALAANAPPDDVIFSHVEPYTVEPVCTDGRDEQEEAG